MVVVQNTYVCQTIQNTTGIATLGRELAPYMEPRMKLVLSILSRQVISMTMRHHAPCVTSFGVHSSLTLLTAHFISEKITHFLLFFLSLPPPPRSLGIIGSGGHEHNGGGAKYLCLPNNPKYDRYDDGWQGTGAIYGTEYEVSSFNPFTTSNLHNHDAPCAVCYVKSRGSQLMVPARNDCPSGWNEEYHGYLMTAHYNHKSSRDFICVDREAEYVHGTQANQNGALLYLVQGSCGPLPCLPYVSGRELTCAVCTK